jgi:hypothetical protein
MKMSFEELLRKGAIEKVAVTPREIGERLSMARRDIRTAEGLVGIDLDWALAVAYSGIRQVSTAYMNFKGYRPHGGEGNHYNVFRFMEEALPEHRPMIKRIQKLRKKRNQVQYDQSGIVSEKEAHEVIEFASKYYTEIAGLLPPEITRNRDEEGSS